MIIFLKKRSSMSPATEAMMEHSCVALLYRWSFIGQSYRRCFICRSQRNCCRKSTFWKRQLLMKNNFWCSVITRIARKSNWRNGFINPLICNGKVGLRYFFYIGRGQHFSRCKITIVVHPANCKTSPIFISPDKPSSKKRHKWVTP